MTAVVNWNRVAADDLTALALDLRFCEEPVRRELEPMVLILGRRLAELRDAGPMPEEGD